MLSELFAEDLKKEKKQSKTIDLLPAQKEWIDFPTIFTRLVLMNQSLTSNAQKQQKTIRETVVYKNAWGEIAFRGPAITFRHLEILFTILSMSQYGANRFQCTTEKSLYYHGTLGEIYRAISKSPKTRPNKKVYDSIHNILLDWMNMIISLRVKHKNNRYLIYNEHILKYKHITEIDEIFVDFYHNFSQFYKRNETTMLHTETILKNVRKDGAKLLYAFVMSHRDNPVWHGDYLKLAEIIKLNMEQPNRYIKQHINTYVKELQKLQILDTENTGWITRQTILLWRNPESLP